SSHDDSRGGREASARRRVADAPPEAAPRVPASRKSDRVVVPVIHDRRTLGADEAAADAPPASDRETAPATHRRATVAHEDALDAAPSAQSSRKSTDRSGMPPRAPATSQIQPAPPVSEHPPAASEPKPVRAPTPSSEHAPVAAASGAG